VTATTSAETTATAPDTAPITNPETTPTAAVVPAPATTTVATATAEPAPTQALPRVTARATPVAAATPATSADRSRVDAMAREFASSPSGNYTVQIQILCDASNVAKLMRSGGESVWFVPQTIGERSCYRVFWGRYTTRDQAQQAMAGIPAAARDRNAAVKAVPKG
jgi:septal ring-binding cell division protein DamX